MTEWAAPIEKVTALITRRGPDGAELLVFEHPRGDVQLPAGTVEPGERFEVAAMREAWDTFVREVAEEACAVVTAVAVIATLRIVEIDERGGPASPVDEHAQLWGRVELDPWEPRFETIGRRLVTPGEAVATTVFPHVTAWLLARAVLIDPALDWPAPGVDP